MGKLRRILVLLALLTVLTELTIAQQQRCKTITTFTRTCEVVRSGRQYIYPVPDDLWDKNCDLAWYRKDGNVLAHPEAALKPPLVNVTSQHLITEEFVDHVYLLIECQGKPIKKYTINYTVQRDSSPPSTAPGQSSQEQNGSNINTAAAVTVPLFLVVLIAAVILVVWVRRRQKPAARDEETPPLDEETPPSPSQAGPDEYQLLNPEENHKEDIIMQESK